jgi:hypothetical protein
MIWRTTEYDTQENTHKWKGSYCRTSKEEREGERNRKKGNNCYFLYENKNSNGYVHIETQTLNWTAPYLYTINFCEGLSSINHILF